MNIRYDLEKLKKIIDDLCTVTGLCMALLDSKGNFLYTHNTDASAFCKKIQSNPEGRARCSCSDKKMIKQCAAECKTVTHICHAGLLDTVVPILKSGILAGFIVIGRVRPTLDPPKVHDTLEWLECDDAELSELYMKQCYLSDDMLSSLINLISNIVFENAIEIDYDKFIKTATDYIDKNLSGALTVDVLCRELFVSKNQLYKSFHSFFSCTVNEYVTSRRIAVAAEMLKNTEESVQDIAETVGLPNYTYFSKLFKKRTGISPHAYRKI